MTSCNYSYFFAVPLCFKIIPLLRACADKMSHCDPLSALTSLIKNTGVGGPKSPSPTLDPGNIRSRTNSICKHCLPWSELTA